MIDAWAGVLILLALPVVTFSKRSRLVGALFLLLFAIFVQQTLIARKVEGAFFGHLMPGIVLCTAGSRAILSEGGPTNVSALSGALGVAVFLGIIGGEYLTSGASRFYNWIHYLIYVLGAGLCLSAGLEDLAWRRTLPVAEIRRCRQVADPALLVGLGALMRARARASSRLPVRPSYPRPHPPAQAWCSSRTSTTRAASRGCGTRRWATSCSRLPPRR